MKRVLGRYDVTAIRRLLDDAGVFDALADKGYAGVEVSIDAATTGLTHTRLHGHKDGDAHALLDVCLSETRIEPGYFVARGYTIGKPVDLVVVYWFREQDPTATFPPERPRLPLQAHPGLGLLRKVFRIAPRMALELGRDGVANIPKFYHDAAIFLRSRLFLFLDGREQGRLEALARDLGPLGLRDASLALAAGCVRDRDGRPAHWLPGFQVFPVSDRLTAYFHSRAYTERVDDALARCSFRWDEEALDVARHTFDSMVALETNE
jgi:hypothetical protein